MADYLLHEGTMVIAYSAYPHKQRDTRPASVANHVPATSAHASQRHIEALTKHGIGNPMMDQVRPEVPLQRAIGGLILREDGWAKLQPTYEQGRVYTKQFVFEGNALKINADCHYGFIQVALLGSNLEPYPGFAAEECIPIHAPKGQIWHDVIWRGDPDVRTLWNRPVRICFHLLESDLYGFQFFYRH